MRKAVAVLVFLVPFALAAKVAEVKWVSLAKYDLAGKKVPKEVSKLLGKRIQITGFMLPLDYSKKSVKEFLLVPYFPACIHVPPPPENQIVMVKADKDFQASYYPVRIEGKLKLAKEKKSNGLMSSGVYEMSLDSLKEIK